MFLQFTFPLVLLCDSVCPLPPPCLFVSLLLRCILYFLDLSIAFCVIPNIFLPCFSLPSSLPLLFSSPTSVSSVSWLLWWGTEYLFLVRNLISGLTLCRPPWPLCLFHFSLFYFSKSYAHSFHPSPSIYILISIICTRPLLPLTGPTCVMLLSLQLTLCLALMCSSPWGHMHNTMCAKRQNMYIHDLLTGFPPESCHYTQLWWMWIFIGTDLYLWHVTADCWYLSHRC